MTAGPSDSTIAAILSFVPISCVRTDVKGTIDNVTEYVH